MRTERHCGGYQVRVADGLIFVTCRLCGPAGTFTARHARQLAAELKGPFGRFCIKAPRPERFRLAALLERAAEGLI